MVKYQFLESLFIETVKYFKTEYIEFNSCLEYSKKLFALVSVGFKMNKAVNTFLCNSVSTKDKFSVSQTQKKGFPKLFLCLLTCIPVKYCGNLSMFLPAPQVNLSG